MAALPRSSRLPGNPAPDRRGGFTLVEVALVASLVGVLTLLIVDALADLARSQAFTSGQARAAEIADRIMRTVVQDVTFSVRVFGDGSEADDYLAAVARPADAVAAGSRLPVPTQRGYFDVDQPGAPDTGNMLLLGRYEEPVTVTVGESDQQLRIDTFSFVYWFLEGAEGGLDLSRWNSVRLARRDDVLAISDFRDRRRALEQLHDAGVRYLWDVDSRAEDGLFAVTRSGLARRLGPSERIPGSGVRSQRRLLRNKPLRVAENGKAGRYVVPRYARAAPSGFPGGFEVKLDGPATGKLVLLRLVLQGVSGGARRNFAESLRFVSCRDG